jgi:hypothetical protein
VLWRNIGSYSRANDAGCGNDARTGVGGHAPIRPGFDGMQEPPISTLQSRPHLRADGDAAMCAHAGAAVAPGDNFRVADDPTRRPEGRST